MKYLHLIRFKNLLLLVFMQLVFRFGFLRLNNVELALTNLQYFLLVLATFLIAAGGYVINTIFDQYSDFESNKKVIVERSVSENSAYNLYFGLNIFGVSIGYYLSNAIQKPSFLIFFIVIATLLYFYSSQLKQIPLVGNVVVALITACSILIIGVFDLFPATDHANKEIMRTYFSILIDYAFMAFLISLISEIIKDLEDNRGVNNKGIRTVPIVLGIRNTTYFVAFLNLIATVLILLYVNNYLMENKLYYATFYILFAIIAPLIYVLIRSLSAKIKSEFHHLNTVLKWIIFFGILSVFIISKNIIYNVK